MMYPEEFQHGAERVAANFKANWDVTTEIHSAQQPCVPIYACEGHTRYRTEPVRVQAHTPEEALEGFDLVLAKYGPRKSTDPAF